MTAPKLDKQIAHAAYRNVSHYPEKRADQEIREYEAATKALEVKLSELVKTPNQSEIATSEVERYRQNYVAKRHAYLSSLSRTASAFIVGPAKFPTASNQKKQDAAHKRLGEFIEWQERAEMAAVQAVLAARTPQQVVADEWQRFEKILNDDLDMIRSIDNGLQPYSRTAFVTSIAGRITRLAANGQTELVNRGLDYIRERQLTFDQPVFTDRHSIWTMGGKAELAAADRKTGSEEIVKTAEFSIIANHDVDRVQILFADIPDTELRGSLKKQGWKWSPSNKAWQRKITPAAVRSAKAILEVAS